MSLETVTENQMEAVRRFFEPSFQVVVKPYRAVQSSTGATVIICNYCHRNQIAGTGFIHKSNCPEFQAKRPRRKEVAITRIFHMTAYAEVDEKGNLVIP